MKFLLLLLLLTFTDAKSLGHSAVSIRKNNFDGIQKMDRFASDVKCMQLKDGDPPLEVIGQGCTDIKGKPEYTLKVENVKGPKWDTFTSGLSSLSGVIFEIDGSDIEAVKFDDLDGIGGHKDITIKNNNDLKEISFTLTDSMNVGKLIIMDNEKLESIKISPTKTFECTEIVINNNPKLKTLEFVGAATYTIPQLTIRQNRQLIEFEGIGKLKPDANVIFQGNRDMKEEDLNQLKSINSSWTIQPRGHCVFDKPIEKLFELDGCVFVDRMIFATGASRAPSCATFSKKGARPLFLSTDYLIAMVMVLSVICVILLAILVVKSLPSKVTRQFSGVERELTIDELLRRQVVLAERQRLARETLLQADEEARVNSDLLRIAYVRQAEGAKRAARDLKLKFDYIGFIENRNGSSICVSSYNVDNPIYYLSILESMPENETQLKPGKVLLKISKALFRLEYVHMIVRWTDMHGHRYTRSLKVPIVDLEHVITTRFVAGRQPGLSDLVIRTKIDCKIETRGTTVLKKHGKAVDNVTVLACTEENIDFTTEAFRGELLFALNLYTRKELYPVYRNAEAIPVA